MLWVWGSISRGVLDRTTSPSIPRGGLLSPGKGPCSCCKFPKIFWLRRWMRRVTTWGVGDRRSSETTAATVRVPLSLLLLGPGPQSPALSGRAASPPSYGSTPWRPAPVRPAQDASSSTCGYRRLMWPRVPSGSLASSVSRTACTVVARGCRVSASTWGPMCMTRAA